MALDPRRTISDLEQLRALTADEHGAQRIAWSDNWLKARAWFQSKLAELPVEHHLDAAGNSWTTLRGDSDRTLILGSHLDSVPNGGWLDGCLGVLTSFEVLRSLAEDLPRQTAGHDSPGGLGRRRRGALRPQPLRFLRICRNPHHTSRPRRVRTATAFASKMPCAVATSMSRGSETRAWSVPTPRPTWSCILSRDPFWKAGSCLWAWCSEPREWNATQLLSMARRRIPGPPPWRSAAMRSPPQPSSRSRFDPLPANIRTRSRPWAASKTFPGIVTAVVGRCETTLDMRDLDAGVLASMLAEAQEASRRFAAEEGCTVEWSRIWSIEPIPFDPRLIELCDQAVRGDRRYVSPITVRAAARCSRGGAGRNPGGDDVYPIAGRPQPQPSGKHQGGASGVGGAGLRPAGQKDHFELESRSVTADLSPAGSPGLPDADVIKSRRDG